MLTPSSGQGHLFDVDSLAPNLLDPDSFAMRLRAIANELFPDSYFADLYSERGRPAYSPQTMMVAIILQNKLNLSDREMEKASRLNLEVKAALGLPLDHPGIPKTCYSEFRARLLKHGRECDAFNLFNQHLVEKEWIKKDEALIVDASHLEANAATPNPRLLIRKATRQILRQLAKERADLYKLLAEKITLRTDTEFASGQDYYLLPEAEKKEQFGKAVGEARIVWKELVTKKLSAGLRANLEMLAVILEERSNDDDEPIDPEQAMPDRIASHRDSDARWGAKGKDKFFFGYKRTLFTTKEHGFVADLCVHPGNTSDASVVPDLLDNSRQLFGLIPSKLLADAAYGSVNNHREVKARQCQLVAAVKPTPNPRGYWSRDEFRYDATAKTLTCPAGRTTKEAHPSPDGEGMVYRFQPHQCGACPKRHLCCGGDFRSVKVAETIPDLSEALAYAKTEAYKLDMKVRPVIEGKHSELVRYHGGRRTRYVGIDRVCLGEVFRCLVVNMKRMFKLEAQRGAMAMG